jgi:hypothetical protein
MLTGWIHRRCLLLMISMDSWCIFSINWPEARTPARSWRAVSGVKAVQLPSCVSYLAHIHPSSPSRLVRPCFPLDSLFFALLDSQLPFSFLSLTLSCAPAAPYCCSIPLCGLESSLSLLCPFSLPPCPSGDPKTTRDQELKCPSNSGRVLVRKLA